MKLNLSYSTTDKMQMREAAQAYLAECKEGMRRELQFNTPLTSCVLYWTDKIVKAIEDINTIQANL